MRNYQQKLCQKYTNWLAQNPELPNDQDAMELLATNLPTPEQRQWLSEFVVEWDSIELAGLLEACVFCHEHEDDCVCD